MVFWQPLRAGVLVLPDNLAGPGVETKDLFDAWDAVAGCALRGDLGVSGALTGHDIDAAGSDRRPTVAAAQRDAPPHLGPARRARIDAPSLAPVPIALWPKA